MTPEEYLAKSADIVARYRRSFERDGVKSALLDAVYFCALYRFPLPKWAKEAFEAAQGRAKSGEIDSWDEVFGKPWGEGRRKTRWMESRTVQIWFDVKALRERGMSIEGAFAKVAATKHMTVPTVRRFYYNLDRIYKKVSQMRSDFEKR
jgi:hypothetical protein